jgi:integrase
MQKVAEGEPRVSIWDDKKGRKHIGIMVDGQRVHRILAPGATASDAKRIEAELRAAMAKAPGSAPKLGDMPMTTALHLYIQHAASLRSASTSEQHALRLAPWAEKYTAAQAREFAAHAVKDLSTQYAPATVNRSLATLKKGLSIAWERGLTPENFGLRIKFVPVNNKREVFLSIEQVGQIAQHCTKQVQAVIWAALLTGARRGELVKIRAEDIGPDTISLPSSHTKTLKPRIIPIIPALRPWLVYFPTTVGVEGIKTAWQRARIKADMPHVNFHDLRHSCASIMLGLGVDLYTISKILGHSTVQTTQRYSHLQVDAQRQALEKLGNLMTG